MAGRQPQGAFFPPNQPGGPVGATPAKAPRGHRGSTTSMAAATADFSLEDEEVLGGDMLDLLTPREISKMRYQQHHEWMEEVFASPYNVKQIVPVDLGIGRKGELEALTAGFFEAPSTAAHPKDQKDGTVALQAGKIEADKAEEFAERVAKRVSDMTAEIEKLKKRHARRMEKVGQLSILKDAEMKLRESAANPSETGTEVWRLEGRIDANDEEDVVQDEFSLRTPRFKVDDVVKDLETSYGRTIDREPSISCVEKGGLLERIEPEPEPVVETAGMEGDVVMDTTLLDQFVASSTSTPGQGPSQGISVGGHGGHDGVHPSRVPGDGDIEMGGASNVSAHSHTAAGETGDWVVVDNATKAGHVQSAAGVDRGHAVDTPNSGFTPGNGGGSGLETSNFDDATNFTNMDSAGDALAAYDDQHDDLDLPDLENSAFGDAFHASDHEMGHHHDEDDMS